MHLHDTRFTVVAVKTVDDSQSNTPVVEVACLKIRGLAVAERFHALVDPEVLLPEEFTRLTGIYPADVITQPLLEDVLPELAKFIERDVIIWTHSPRKSHAVHRHFRLTQPREKEFFLHTLAEHTLPDTSRHSLSALADFYQLPDCNPIRATAMADAAGMVFLKLLETIRTDHGIDSMVDLLAFCPAPKKDTRRSKRNLPFDSDRLREYPTSPGVYFMKNRLGEILYVGKAKNLRNRLRSYFQKQSRLAPKIAGMMKQVAMIDVIRVGSELEALLLEARLIKKHQPFFNKKIKDYQGMAFMKVSLNSDWPRVSAEFETDEPGAAYFGPFARKTGLEMRLEILNRIFKLRSCSDSVFREHRNSPCMQYHLGLCSGPCAGHISQEDYRACVEDFIAYLEQKPSRIVEHLLAKRDAYSEELMFEKAAALHSQLEALEQLQWRSHSFIQAVEEHNCLILLPDAEPGAVRFLCVLQGQPWQWRSFHPERDGLDRLELLVEDFHDGLKHSERVTNIPKSMYEEARLLANWLAQREEDEGAVIYLNRKKPQKILAELQKALPEVVSTEFQQPRKELIDSDESHAELLEIITDDWEREWAAGE